MESLYCLSQEEFNLVYNDIIRFKTQKGYDRLTLIKDRCFWKPTLEKKPNFFTRVFRWIKSKLGFDDIAYNLTKIAIIIADFFKKNHKFMEKAPSIKCNEELLKILAKEDIQILINDSKEEKVTNDLKEEKVTNDLSSILKEEGILLSKELEGEVYQFFSEDEVCEILKDDPAISKVFPFLGQLKSPILQKLPLENVCELFMENEQQMIDFHPILADRKDENLSLYVDLALFSLPPSLKQENWEFKSLPEKYKIIVDIADKHTPFLLQNFSKYANIKNIANKLLLYEDQIPINEIQIALNQACDTDNSVLVAIILEKINKSNLKNMVISCFNYASKFKSPKIIEQCVNLHVKSNFLCPNHIFDAFRYGICKNNEENLKPLMRLSNSLERDHVSALFNIICPISIYDYERDINNINIEVLLPLVYKLENYEFEEVVKRCRSLSHIKSFIKCGDKLSSQLLMLKLKQINLYK